MVPRNKTNARLVIKGFVQKEGADYLQMLASTPAASSLNSVMAVAIELKYKVPGMPPKCSTDGYKVWMLVYCLAGLCVSNIPYMARSRVGCCGTTCWLWS